MYYAASPASSLGSTYSTTSASSIDIKSSRAARPTSPSCAYPSWPRRSSLSGITEEATSFISDDDLFAEVFEDESAEASPLATPHQATSPNVTNHNGEPISSSVLRHLLALQKQQQQQCYLPTAKPKKKRRSSKKSGSSSLTKGMSVIVEATEQGRDG